ncbi:MAG: glycosyltransferase, partial [Chthoniobacteraceae bacterium]
MPGLEIHVISCTQRPMQAPEKLSPNIWFHLLDVPKIGWLRTGYQGCIRAIRKKVRELGPDLVHGQGTERECALGAVLSGFPSVVTIHGNMGQVARRLNARIGSYLWCTARLESYALRRAAAVFCNSSYTEQAVRKNNLRTWLVPNALRLAFFDTPLPPPPNPTVPTFLNVGSVLPYKRQRELLEIAIRLSRKGHRFKVLFVGGTGARGSYASGLRQRLAEPGISSFAEFAGEKNLPELIRHYDAGSALVH